MQWQVKINETVFAAKEFLDGELAGKEWEDSLKYMRVLFDSKHAYQQAKNKKTGVGEPTILKFLGGNWKQRKTILQEIFLWHSGKEFRG